MRTAGFGAWGCPSPHHRQQDIDFILCLSFNACANVLLCSQKGSYQAVCGEYVFHIYQVSCRGEKIENGSHGESRE